MKEIRRLTGAVRLTSGSKSDEELIATIAVPSDGYTIRFAQKKGDPAICGRVTIRANECDTTIEDLFRRFRNILESFQQLDDVDIDLWVTVESSNTQIGLDVDRTVIRALSAVGASLVVSVYADCDE